MGKRITNDDIEKGVAKVERMNALFDRLIFPVLLVIALAVFIFGALPKLKKSCAPEEEIKPSEVPQTVPAVSESDGFYAERNEYLLSMTDHSAELEEKGYTLVDIMEGMKSAHIALDENTTVYEFCDGDMCYGQIKYTGSESFEQVSVTVIDEKQFNVALTGNDGEKLYAKFSSPDFMPKTGDDDQQMILAFLTPNELARLKERYDAQLEILLG